MPILHMKKGESTEDLKKRRLQEKVHGKALSKLKVLATYKQLNDEYIYSQIQSAGIPMEMVKEEVPEAYKRVEKYLDSKKEDPKKEYEPKPASKKKSKKS